MTPSLRSLLLIATLLSALAGLPAQASPCGFFEELLLPLRTRLEELRPGAELPIEKFDGDFALYRLAHDGLSPRKRQREARKLAKRFLRIVKKQGYKARLINFDDGSGARSAVELLGVPASSPDLRMTLARGLATHLIFDPELLAQRDSVAAVAQLSGFAFYFVPSDILYSELSHAHLHEVVHLHEAKLLQAGRSSPYQATLRALDEEPLTADYTQLLSAEEMLTHAKELRWARSPKVVVFQSEQELATLLGRVSDAFVLAYQAAFTALANDPERVRFVASAKAENLVLARVNYREAVFGSSGLTRAPRSLDIYLPEIGPNLSRAEMIVALEKKLVKMMATARRHQETARQALTDLAHAPAAP